MTPSEQIKELHEAYVAATGLEIRYNMDVERVWFAWWKEGWSVDDLRLTIHYVRKLYEKEQRIVTASLRLRKLIGDTLWFAEHLAEARAVARVKSVAMNPGKAEVMRATNRPAEPEHPPGRTIGEVLEAMRKAAQ